MLFLLNPASVVDSFYSADAAIVDLSIADQQNALFYHLGVRESFGMKHNILLFNELIPESGKELRLNIIPSHNNFVTYNVIESMNGSKHCIVTEPVLRLVENSREESSSSSPSAPVPYDPKAGLGLRIRKLLEEVEVQTKAHMKERFLSDLRKARESFSGSELRDVLKKMRRRLDDPNIISNDVVHNMMLSFREIQDYDAMVQLIDDLQGVFDYTSTPAILNFYAFALNRRNQEGDRSKGMYLLMMMMMIMTCDEF